ncbi:MAG TPA: hypothetical protein VMV46_05320 [Thermoanaerobaculia bacterium]|nr:hypothetical protein [Thermoanaerobaculia bacterium]
MSTLESIPAPFMAPIAAALALVAAAAPAQEPEPGPPAGHDHAHHAAMLAGSPGAPTLAAPGDAIFAAIEEAVGLLEADPDTDWSRVDLDALRAHLVDMHVLFGRTEARTEEVPGGARFRVVGPADALEAARRMVPAHAAAMTRAADEGGWTYRASVEGEAVVLEVTGADAAATARIRGLGFFGVMASGGHHRVHHLAIARGQADAHAH